MAELSSGCVARSYSWGPDLSGSLQGAGGIGGLVFVRDSSTSGSYYPAYDGNGNLTAMILASSGAAVAKYEYSPYGELLTSTGTYASTNPFRFSTKYTDSETNLAYFGYRYYNPETGRWINRDPSQERGGKNLYQYVFNAPTNGIDYLGLACCGGKSYDPEVSCCCKDKIISKENVDTGIKICTTPYTHWWHSYFKIDKWTAGFGPVDSLWGEGKVNIPEDSASDTDSCVSVYASPCSIDFEKLKNRIKDIAEKSKANPPGYYFPFSQCKSWVWNVMADALDFDAINGCTCGQ
jgi:RHS repeat-associated protein